MSVDPNAPNPDPNEKPADDKTGAAPANTPTVPADYEDIKAKLAKLESAEEARKTAALSETEKVQKAADDANARATALETKLAQRDAVALFEKANVIDTDLAYGAIAAKIEMKDGEPINIKALVEKFIADKPHMVKVEGEQNRQAPQTHSSNPGAASEKPADRKKIPGKF